MKRSRMTYLLTIALKEIGFTKSPDYDIYEDPTIEDGEKLLNIIEKLGMIPPDNGGLDYRDVPGYKRKNLVWEPENGE